MSAWSMVSVTPGDVRARTFAATSIAMALGLIAWVSRASVLMFRVLQKSSDSEPPSASLPAYTHVMSRRDDKRHWGRRSIAGDHADARNEVRQVRLEANGQTRQADQRREGW